jgi:crossover junction endodeoxyribonuclease RuvC
MIILGIDPGLSGALALYDTSEQTVEVFDMPALELVRNGKTKREVSAQALANLLAGRGIKAAFLERVNAMPGQGVTSVFSFGRSTGIVEGILAAYDIPTTLVTPQAWQKAVGQRAGKDGSRERAMQLFPAQADLFQRKKDDGRSDAALIAYYGAKLS